MKAFILLALALCVSLSAAFEVTGAKADTLRPLPGIDRLGLGVDIKTGKTLMPAVTITYHGSQQFYNPYLSQYHALSDQVATTYADSYTSSASYFYDSYSSFANSHAKSDDGSSYYSDYLDDTYYGGSYYASLAHFTASYFSSGYVFSNYEELVSLYEASLYGAAFLQPSEVLAATIAALPAEYDAAAYRALIRNFGTHYLYQASYGGSLSTALAYSSAYSSYVSSNYHSISSGYFYNYTSSASSTNGANSQGTDGAYSVSTSSFLTYGGSYYEARAGSDGNSTSVVQAWAKSLPFAPAVIRGRVAPLSALVADAGKKALVEKAIVEYLKN